MTEPNRSLKRDTTPIVKLVTPEKKQHVVGVKVMCACSDMKERQVLLDAKLSKAVLSFIQHRQGGVLQLSEGIPMKFATPPTPAPISVEKERDELHCGRCSGEIFGNFAHKDTGKFKCADQIPEPRPTCILDCDSPTLPPNNQEQMQCGCAQCRKDLSNEKTDTQTN